MATLDVRPPVGDHSRVRENRRRSALLLMGATGIVLPFALVWSYCLAHGVVYLVASGRGISVSPLLVLALSAPMLAMPVLLFLRLAYPPVRTLPLCGPVAFRTPALEARQLLEKLAARAGLPVPRLYVIDTLGPNAFSVGVKPAHAIVIVTRGLLDLLERREIEAVLAHELLHIVNYDTRWNMVVAAVALFLRLPFPSHRAGPAHCRIAQGARRNPFGIFLLPFTPVILLTAPLLAVLLEAVACPGRKGQADLEAARLTGDPASLIGALVKLKFAGAAIPESDPVVAHLYFADPSPTRMMGISRGRLFTSHPPMDDRIAALERSAGDADPALIEAAADSGRQFADHREGWADQEGIQSHDLAFVAEGNRVCEAMRVSESSHVYEEDDVKSPVVAQVRRGDLVITFHQAGTLQQIVTPEGEFGFLPRSVKLKPTDRLPQDVLQGTDVQPPEFMRLRRPAHTLTRRHLTLATLFGFVVFVAVVSLMSLTR